MKILFIQLPLLDHGGGYIAGNVEYAPAQLSGFLEKNYPATEPLMLPGLLSLFASNKMIIAYIKELNPDILCFTMYLWNSERQLVIAKTVREELPDSLIVCGGPEVTTGSFLFQRKNDFIDFFISGEGEWFFDNLFEGKLEPGFIEQPAEELLPISEIVEPFTSGHLQPMIDKTVYLELTRGCPFKCTYCFYSKNCSTVREHDHSLLIEALKHHKNIDEIYILSPTLNSKKDFKDLLKKIAKNNNGIKLHSELRPELIDEETAFLMYDAGFRSLEVGLQTLTPSVRQAVNRSGDPMREIEGILYLKDAGIELKIGIIPGLPGETADTFQKTIDLLFENDLGDSIELYPLMVLPGTTIRENADKQKIIYQQKPPYFYEGGWGMSKEDIVNLAYNLEMETGLTFSSYSLPDFTLKKEGDLCNSLYIKDIFNIDFDVINDSMESAVTTVFIENHKNLYLGLNVFFKEVFSAELLRMVIIDGSILNEEKILPLFENNDHDIFSKRSALFQSEVNINPYQFFHLIKNIEKYRTCEEEYEFVFPVLEVSSEVFSQLNGDEAILVKESEYEKLKDDLIVLYSDNQEDVTFESEENRRDFYLHTGLDYIEYPYSFYTKLFS